MAGRLVESFFSSLLICVCSVFVVCMLLCVRVRVGADVSVENPYTN